MTEGSNPVDLLGIGEIEAKIKEIKPNINNEGSDEVVKETVKLFEEKMDALNSHFMDLVSTINSVEIKFVRRPKHPASETRQ